MVYFISGIDTDTGKSVITGLLARSLKKKKVNVITQKFIQTGCTGISEDILTHRRMMGIDITAEDTDGTTCPYVMTYPASPHLAIEMDGVAFDLERIKTATRKLENNYAQILLEGAGGLYVPVTREYYTIDYICDNNYPLILVTSSKLGSINHTLLSLEACRQRGIRLACLVYNRYPNDSPFIMEDSACFLKTYLQRHFPEAAFIEVPELDGNSYPEVDTGWMIF